MRLHKGKVMANKLFKLIERYKYYISHHLSDEDKEMAEQNLRLQPHVTVISGSSFWFSWEKVKIDEQPVNERKSE